MTRQLLAVAQIAHDTRRDVIDLVHAVAEGEDARARELPPTRTRQVVEDDLRLVTSALHPGCGATGAEFAILPPQNASGNWVKVVQRLPVRIRLLPQPEDLDAVGAAAAGGDVCTTICASSGLFFGSANCPPRAASSRNTSGRKNSTRSCTSSTARCLP